MRGSSPQSSIFKPGAFWKKKLHKDRMLITELNNLFKLSLFIFLFRSYLVNLFIPYLKKISEFFFLNFILNIVKILLSELSK